MFSRHKHRYNVLYASSAKETKLCHLVQENNSLILAIA